MKKMPDQLVVILGMHRSGTSLVASGLPLLGFPLGNNLMPGNEDNPKGFFEDLNLVSLNNDLMSFNYSSWDSPFGNLGRELKFTKDHEKRAKILLQQRFVKTDKSAIKDPRLCMLMPFWQAQFEANNIRARYVGVHREPLAIAASLQKRNQFSQRHSLLLCYIYLRTMMSTLGDDAFFISYDKFVDEPNFQLARLASHLDAQLDHAEIDSFLHLNLEPALRHHRDLSGELFPALEHLSRLMMGLASDKPISISSALGQQPQDQGLERELLAIQVQRDFAERLRLSQQNLSLEVDNLSLEVDKKLLYSDLADSHSRIEEREKHIGLMKEETSRLGHELKKSVSILGERDDLIDQLRETRERLEKETASLSAGLDQKNAEIKEMDRHLKDFDRIHRELLNSVSFRLGRILTFPVRKPLNIFLLNRLEDDSFWKKIIGLLRNSVSHPILILKLLSFSRLKNFFLLLTKRRDLVDQIVTNYNEMVAHKSPERFVDLRQHSESELQAYRLTLKTSNAPLVSILIPVYNQLNHTLQCLESIARNSPTVPYEVIIANDCSTDATAEVVGRIKGIRLVNNEKNLKFLSNCNHATEYCRGDFICILNNDTSVKPGWLDLILTVFDSRADAGLVGSKLIYPDGRLQEAGAIVWNDGSAWNYGKLEDPSLPEYNYLREVDYVSGASIVMRRKLFEDLGRFDTRFEPAYYEDTDLAFKVRAAGLKVYYQPRSEVVHYEGVSHGTDESGGIKKYQLENRRRFFAKWQSVLTTEHFPNGKSVFRARDRSGKKTTVLVIDHYVPHFDKDAGSRSTFLYLRLLVDAGCQIKFMGDNFYQHEPYTQTLQDMGIEVLYGRYYEKNWKSWLLNQAPEIDVVYMMRPHIAEKYIDTVNRMEPKPRTIYFGHDLHFLRSKRQAEISQDASIAREAANWQDKEFALFRKLDRIYYPSDVEVEEIKKKEPGLPVKAIPLYPIQEFDQSSVDFIEREGLLFVGGFNHPPNADGLLWFVDQVLPQIRSDIRLNIVGSNMPSRIRSLDNDQIDVRGFLSDKDLDDLYRRVRIAIVPLRFGAGVKGKVLEAMNLGVPVVTTSIGAEGIPTSADLLFVTNSADRMAHQINSIINDIELLNKHSELGRQAVRRYFSAESALSIISEDFLLQPR